MNVHSPTRSTASIHFSKTNHQKQFGKLDRKIESESEQKPVLVKDWKFSKEKLKSINAMQKKHSPPTNSHIVRDQHCRTSGVSGSREDRKFSTSSLSGETDRDRHWKTILGHTPHLPQSCPSSSFRMKPKQYSSKNAVVSVRSNHSDSLSSTPQTELRVPSHTSLEFVPHPASPSNAPHKPFSCDHCDRRFERRGHLKVCNSHLG